MLAAVALLNVSNYGFHIAVSRALGPEEYGALAALLAILMIASVPLGIAQTVVARRIALLREEGDDHTAMSFAAGTAKALAVIGLVAAAASLAATPALATFLRSNEAAAALVAPYVLFAVLTSLPLGVLQGARRFGWFAGASVVGVVARLVGGIGLVWAGFGVTGAVAGVALGQAVTLVVAWGATRVPWSELRRVRASYDAVRGEFVVTGLALASFWFLAELDIVLSRHYLAADEAGLYSSAGLVARGLLFVVGGVSLAALPRFVTARATGLEGLHWLRLTVGVVAVVAAVGVVSLALLRELLIPFAYGSEYAAAAALLPILALAVAFLAIANVLVYFHIAARTRAYVFLLAAAAVELPLAALFHSDGRELALVVLGVSAATAGLMLHAAVAATRWAPAGLATATNLAASPTCELSVVLPCHNAGDSLGRVLEDAAEALEGVETWELIVVSDGSTDDTVAIARASTRSVRVLHYDERVGKGHALHVGLSDARGRYVAFLDADGDLPAASLRPFVTLMHLYRPDIVLGSKRHPLSELDYPALRRFLSWGYHRLARLLFRVRVNDTQTGLKLIRRDVLADVLPRMLEKRYAFDLELLVVARVRGYTRLFEAPIRLDYQFSSRINVRATMRIAVDTLAIFYRRYILGTYGSPAQRAPVARPALPEPLAPTLSGNFATRP